MWSRRSARWAILILVMVVGGLCPSWTCFGAPLMLAIHDSDEADGIDSNLDGSPDTVAHGPSYVLFANNSPTEKPATAVTFALNSLPQNATIETAVLEMTCEAASATPGLTLRFAAVASADGV